MHSNEGNVETEFDAKCLQLSANQAKICRITMTTH